MRFISVFFGVYGNFYEASKRNGLSAPANTYMLKNTQIFWAVTKYDKDIIADEVKHIWLKSMQ